MDDRHLLESLTELGLTRNEARIYLCLLDLGQSSAGSLISHSKLHRQLVYQGLERLIEHGLATKQLKAKKFLFSPSNPAELERRTERQLQKATMLSKALSSKFYKKAESVEVRVLYGKEGLYDNLIESINSAKRSRSPIRILTGINTAQFWEILGDGDDEKYLKLSEKAKVRKLLIAHPSYPANKRQRIFGKGNAKNEIRYQKNLPTLPSSTRITKEYVAIEVYEPQVFVIQILSPLVAQAYIEYFNIMWATSKKTSRAKP